LVINSIGKIESLISVTGLNTPLSSYATITLQIWLVHSYTKECEIRLYGPDGSYIMISNKRGEYYANVFDGTLFLDSALNSVVTYLFSNNVLASPLRPEQPLSYFRGKNPNGQWKLWINDAFEGDSGVLNGVILNIQGFLFTLFIYFRNKNCNQNKTIK